MKQQQRHNHRIRTLSRSHLGLKLILLPNIRPRFCCCQARKIVKLAWRLAYSNVSSRENNQNKHTVMKQRKWLSTYRQSKLMKIPSPATVGPAKDKHQALTYRWKFYSRAVNESEA